MIHLDKDLYLDADDMQFFIKRRIKAIEPDENGKGRAERFDFVGSYPSIATLIRGLSDRKMYDAVKRCGSLKAVQDDFVSWAEGFRTPLIENLKAAVKAYEGSE